MLGGLIMFNNPIFMKGLLIVLFPAIMLSHMGYGIWLGLVSGLEEFRMGWKSPTSNRWNKTKWE